MTNRVRNWCVWHRLIQMWRLCTSNAATKVQSQITCFRDPNDWTKDTASIGMCMSRERLLHQSIAVSSCGDRSRRFGAFKSSTFPAFIITVESNQRLAIIGHSYVRWLREFMGWPVHGMWTCGFGGQPLTVWVYGRARGSDCSPKSIRRQVDLWRCVNADVAILHMRENDHQRMSAEATAAEINALAWELLEQYNVSNTQHRGNTWTADVSCARYTMVPACEPPNTWSYRRLMLYSMVLVTPSWTLQSPSVAVWPGTSSPRSWRHGAVWEWRETGCGRCTGERLVWTKSSLGNCPNLEYL